MLPCNDCGDCPTIDILGFQSMVEICFHRLQCAGHMYRTLTAYCIYLKPKGIPFVWPGSAVPFGPWQPHIQLLQPQATIQQPLSSALPLQSAPSRPETSRVEKMSSAHAPLLALPAPEPMDLEAKPARDSTGFPLGNSSSKTPLFVFV